MKNVREALEVNRDTGVLTDYLEAKTIELMAGVDGKVWVNVDGVCVLRIRYVDAIRIEHLDRTVWRHEEAKR
jgi:hypothetical protein